MASRGSDAPENLRALLRAYRAPLLVTAGLVALYLVHTRPAQEDLRRLERVQASVTAELELLRTERAELEQRVQAALDDPLYHERLMHAHFGKTVFPEAALLREPDETRGSDEGAAADGS